MATQVSMQQRLMMEQVLQEEANEGASRHPMVLSCGGIYIPQHQRRFNNQLQVLTTSNELEPVKMVSGARPRSELQQMLIRESLN